MSSNEPKQASEKRESKLLHRYGKVLFKGGLTCFPTLLFRHQRALQINPTQINIIEQIWTYWHDANPYPSVGTIGYSINRGKRCIQVNLRKLASPIIDEDGVVLRPALIEIVERTTEKGDSDSNEYNLLPLLGYLEQLEIQKQQGVMNKNAGGDESRFRRVMNLDSGGVMNLDSPEVVSNNEEVIYEKNRFESSNENAEGRVFGNLDSDSDSFSTQSTNPHSSHNHSNKNHQSNNENYNGNASHNNYQPPNQNRKNETQREEERPRLSVYNTAQITDLSRLFNNIDSLESNKTRAARIFEPFKQLNIDGVDEHWFGELITWAREKAQQAAVNKRNGQGQVNRMPYFFRCLEAEADAVMNNYLESLESAKANQKELSHSESNRA